MLFQVQKTSAMVNGNAYTLSHYQRRISNLTGTPEISVFPSTTILPTVFLRPFDQMLQKVKPGESFDALVIIDKISDDRRRASLLQFTAESASLISTSPLRLIAGGFYHAFGLKQTVFGRDAGFEVEPHSTRFVHLTSEVSETRCYKTLVLQRKLQTK